MCEVLDITFNAYLPYRKLRNRAQTLKIEMEMYVLSKRRKLICGGKKFIIFVGKLTSTKMFPPT